MNVGYNNCSNRFIDRILFILICCSLLFACGCAYFNSYYLAQRNFKDAERLRERDNGIVTLETKKKYNDAIQWSSEVYNRYKKSRYVDDSMFIIGMSYYHISDFVQARNVFNRLIEVFPESKFIPEAKFYKARSLMGMSEYDEARQVLQELVQSGNRTMRGRASLALAEINFVHE